MDRKNYVHDRSHCQWCSAINCKNSRKSRPGLSFFRFPRDEDRSRKWVINCRRQDLLEKSADTLWRSNVLCAEHFEDSQFTNSVGAKGIRLRSKKAIPTIFNFDLSNYSNTLNGHQDEQLILTKLAVPKYPAWKPEPKHSSSKPFVEDAANQKEETVDESLRNGSMKEISFLENLMFSSTNFDKLRKECGRLILEVNKLRNIIDEVKDAARINLDLLTLTLDFANNAQSSAELDKVSKLVTLILNDIEHQVVDPRQSFEECLDVGCFDEQNGYMTLQGLDFCDESKDFQSSISTREITKAMDEVKSELNDDEGDNIYKGFSFSGDERRNIFQNGLNAGDQGEFTSNVCIYCEKKFSSKKSLAEHQRTHKRVEKAVHCLHCDKRFFFTSSLKCHFKLFHSRVKWRRYKCEFCDEGFPHKTALALHKRSQHGQNVAISYKQEWGEGAICDKCGKVFSSSANLRSHIKTHLKRKKTYKCSVCDEQFIYVKDRERHMMESHPTIKQHICNICKREYSTQSKLRHHIHGIHHRSFLVHCKLCNRSFSKNNLGRHMKLHAGEKPHRCQFCSHGFSEREELDHHITVCKRKNMPVKRWTHRPKQEMSARLKRTYGVRKYTCPKCSLKCTRILSLERHIELVHQGEKPHVCSTCNKTFFLSESLESHQRVVHKMLGTHICDICGKLLANQSTLTRHKWVHLGIKPFSCEVCARKFSTKAILELHTWTHKNEKKFNCENCGRGFNDKRNFVSHQVRCLRNRMNGDVGEVVQKKLV